MNKYINIYNIYIYILNCTVTHTLQLVTHTKFPSVQIIILMIINIEYNYMVLYTHNLNYTHQLTSKSIFQRTYHSIAGCLAQLVCMRECFAFPGMRNWLVNVPYIPVLQKEIIF